MGSVKDLVVLKVPTQKEMGVGRFDFSNRYSVFDWGEMPDYIPNKGASLCAMSAYFFERLADKGVRTHYIGLEDADNPSSLYSVSAPPTKMIIKLARSVKPLTVVRDGMPAGYDYSFYSDAQDDSEGNFVIPIEFMYRNTLPKGSSVFRRLRERSLTLKSIGLTEMPKEGEKLPDMFIDASTKYEASDRYPDERKKEDLITFLTGLAYLKHGEIVRAGYLLREAESVVTNGISRAGLRHDDGKIEFVFTPERELMVGDTLGTLDECRFTYPLDGQWVEVSKEIPRQWYRNMQPVWVAEMDSAKKSYGAGWNSYVKTRPEPMPPALLEILSNVYASTANAVIGKNLFGAPELPEVVKEYQRFIELTHRRT